jgi:predicted lipid-binding transport protein (Tim44 family)
MGQHLRLFIAHSIHQEWQHASIWFQPPLDDEDGSMKTRWFSAALALVLAVSLSPDLADAKRLGSGKNSGMQRQAPAQQNTPQTPPSQAPAAPSTAAAPAGVPAGAAAAAAAPAKRSWMGPLAGLAAGLGLAALFSSLGMGEAFGSFMMMLLMGLVAFFAIRFIMSRMRGGSQPALASAGAGAAGAAPAWRAHAPQAPLAAEPVRFDASDATNTGSATAGSGVSVTGQPLRPIQIGEALGSPAVMAAGAAAGPLSLPEGFDLPAFERVAKMIFIRLQAANDKADLDDLRQFTTPEMFAAVRLDLQDRGSATQHTDVQRVDAELIEFAQEPSRHVASVRFKGLIVEEAGAAAEAFDEIWHLVKATDGSSSWAIAGIQQPQ